MSKLLRLFIICIFSISQVGATVPKSIIERFHLIVKLINENKPEELAKLVSYPLCRAYPLNKINGKKDFIRYYDTLIDANFRNKLKKFSDKEIGEHHFLYGLVGDNFSGDIWLNEDGEITTINYQSALEEALVEKLTAKIKKEMHPSVADWDENIIVAKSAKLLVRVDRTSKGLRYACWSKNKSEAEAPDIILFNGEEERYGTMGGWSWTFKNKDWTYIVSDMKMCETPKDCGLFLEIWFLKKLNSNIKLNKLH